MLFREAAPPHVLVLSIGQNELQTGLARRGNVTSHDTATIALDADFVARARAVSATGGVDQDLLAALLEVGLQSVEQSAANEQPVEIAPALHAELVRLFDRLDDYAEEAQAGRPQERPVTIMVTDASLLLMAFLDRLIRARTGQELPSDRAEIDLGRPADIEGAMRYLTNLLVGQLDGELALMVQARHPLFRTGCGALPSGGGMKH